jgi:hypothetical protein
MRARVIRKPMTCAQCFFWWQNRKGGADKSTCKERQQQGKPKTTIYHYDAEPASMQPFHCTALCRAKPSSECPRHSRQLQCREQKETQSSPQRLTCRTPVAATAPTHTSCRAYAHATPTQMRPTWDNAGRQAPNNSRGVLVRDDTRKKHASSTNQHHPSAKSRYSLDMTMTRVMLAQISIRFRQIF